MKRVKDIEEWNRNIMATRLDLMNWATGIQGTPKANLLFMGLIGLLILISWFFHWKTMVAVLSIMNMFILYGMLKGMYKKWKKKKNSMNY